jgi:hypothetical protein
MNFCEELKWRGMILINKAGLFFICIFAGCQCKKIADLEVKYLCPVNKQRLLCHVTNEQAFKHTSNY